MNLNQSDLSVFYEARVALINADFPWDDTRITALSNRYMNARTDKGNFSYKCSTNEVCALYKHDISLYNYSSHIITCMYMFTIKHVYSHRERVGEASNRYSLSSYFGQYFCLCYADMD